MQEFVDPSKGNKCANGITSCVFVASLGNLNFEL